MLPALGVALATRCDAAHDWKEPRNLQRGGGSRKESLREERGKSWEGAPPLPEISSPGSRGTSNPQQGAHSVLSLRNCVLPCDWICGARGKMVCATEIHLIMVPVTQGGLNYNFLAQNLALLTPFLFWTNIFFPGIQAHHQIAWQWGQ